MLYLLYGSYDGTRWHPVTFASDVAALVSDIDGGFDEYRIVLTDGTRDHGVAMPRPVPMPMPKPTPVAMNAAEAKRRFGGRAVGVDRPAKPPLTAEQKRKPVTPSK